MSHACLPDSLVLLLLMVLSVLQAGCGGNESIDLTADQTPGTESRVDRSSEPTGPLDLAQAVEPVSESPAAQAVTSPDVDGPAPASGSGDRSLPSTPMNLSAAISGAQDIIRGHVESRNSVLRLIGRDALVRIPIRATGNYDLAARLRRTVGEQQMVLIIPVGDRHASVILDWNTHDLHGLETIDGQNLKANGQSREIIFENHKWYDLLVSVRYQMDEVVLAAQLGDQSLFQWKGSPDSLTVWHPWTLTESGTFGLANWESGPEMVVEYERLELVPQGGTVTDLGSSRAVALKGSAVVAASPPELPPGQTQTPAASTSAPAAAPPVAVVSVPSGGGDWPCFRGPGRLGISSDQGLPVTWSDGGNIVWKSEIPGPGASSPIVWGDHIYVTCYSGYGLSETEPGDQTSLQRHLLCFDRESGRRLWKSDMPHRGTDGGFSGFRALHGYATSTPLADESGIYVMYGASGVAAYNHRGELRWQRSLGTAIHDWGSSASPVAFENLVIFHADIEAGRLHALDQETGEPVWSVPTGRGDSWSTPCLAEVGGRHELIFHHSQGDPTATLAAVNPRDGTALWQCQVLKDYLCPSPIVAADRCFVLGYQRGAAVRLGGQGDVTGSHIEWTTTRGTEVCTPLYHNGHLYWAHQDSGVAYCLDAQSGRIVYEERIQPRPGKMYASGVLADGNIYYVSRESGTYVVAAEPQYRLLAHNVIESDDSVFNGTPAISHGRLVLRSNRFLYCIGNRF